MKRLFITCFIFVLIFILSVGAFIWNNKYKKVSVTVDDIQTENTSNILEYKNIPINLREQYKKEIEQIINKEYNIIIKNINDSVEEAKNLYDKMLKEGFNKEDYIRLSLIPDTNIPSADLDLYIILLQITMEKYLGIKYKYIGTDSINTIYEFLSPYFKDNNVNEEKLSEILLYKNQQIKIVENYIKQIEQIYSSNI